jgi:hypothetical protein
MTRKTSVAAFLLFLTLGIPVVAETVMVYVEEQGPGVSGDGVRYYLSAVEDGVMDVFFDAGYIIFNAGTPRNAEEASQESDAEVLDIALTGGAQLVIRVAVKLEKGRSDELFPVYHAYSVRKVGSPREHSGDSGNVDSLVDDPRQGVQSGFNLGQAIARRVLSQL